MLFGSCHCGAVRVEVAGPPKYIIDCNCSICRRNGALWGLYEPAAVRLSGQDDNAVPYVWGPETLKTMHCRHCGCVVYWEELKPGHGGKMGVNFRNFDPAARQGIRVRRFDGAVSWAFLD